MKGFSEGTRRGLYRARDGVVLGVCKGIAEFFDFPEFWTRVVVLGLLIFTGIWPILGLYFLAALFLKPKPVLPLQSEEDQEFYNSYVNSRGMALRRLKRVSDALDRRIQRMEDIVTAREFDWEQRLKR